MRLKSPNITWLLQNALEASDQWRQWPDVKRQDPPRGPSEDTGVSTWLPEFPSSCFKLGPLPIPPSTTEAFSDDHESSVPESASASRATSSKFTDWKFPLWIFSMLAPMGCRNQLCSWEELSRCASMPDLGLAWGTWSSWFSDGFLEGNQSDLFSIFLTHRVHACIHRSKVVYKWTKNLSSFLGGKKASSCHIRKHPYSARRCGGN